MESMMRVVRLEGLKAEELVVFYLALESRTGTTGESYRRQIQLRVANNLSKMKSLPYNK